MTNERCAHARRVPLSVSALALLLGLALPPAALAGPPGISDARAREIALRAVPGKVVEVERERGEIEVVIRTPQGELKEVEIDPRSGRILKIEDEEEDEGHASEDEREGADD